MTEERWRQIEQLYHSALEIAESRRAAFLAATCAGDEDLRREVESLLASHEQAGTFIDRSPDDVVAGMLAEQKSRSIIGSTLGHYRIDSLIGAGGMGEVYRAHDTRLDRDVAVKILPEHFADNPEALYRFEREARAVAALSHPNILSIFDFGSEQGVSYAVMELLEGETLREALTRSPMDWRRAVEIGVAVAEGLAAAHAKGIIHRDLKLENVMVRLDGYVKVLDFGLAKLTEPIRRGTSDQISTAIGLSTETGVVMGTVRYMSPEQARGQKVDWRTDIFSLGVVLYETVTGRAPFAGETPNDVIAAILMAEPPPLARFAPRAPSGLQQIVDKALHKDREGRYQSVRELLADLAEVKEPSRAAAAGASLFKQMTRRRVLLAVSAALLALIAATPWLTPKLKQGLQIDQPPVLRPLSRLTFEPGLQSEPSWSPDSRLIAYSSDQSGNFDIWVKPVGEGNAVAVTKSPNHDWQPAWSPVDNRIVFRSERDGGGLYVVPTLGGNERKVAGFGYRPQWSPDGSRILFYSSILQNVGWRPQIYVVGFDGQPPREVLTGFVSEFTTLRVGWHPDGQRLSLWGYDVKKQEWGFWTAPLAGGKPVKSEVSEKVERQWKEAAVEFSNNVWISRFLWAPSGRALYFEGISQGVGNLWKIEIEPKTLRWIAGPERLTTGPGRDVDAALSPDGRKLAYTTQTESTRIWLLPCETSTGQAKGGGQPVTPAGLDAVLPDLSRDGKRLAFVARRAGKEELWEKTFDDSREILLRAPDEFTRFSLRWSRDGKRLAYRRSRLIDAERGLFERSIVWLADGGGEEHQLTSTGPASENPYDWSADGEWVVGGSNRQTPERWALYRFPLAAAPRAETQMQMITSHPEYNLWQARLSPDEQWVCFSAIRAAGADGSTVFVVPAAGGAWTRITEDKYWDGKPRWSLDGRTLYFSSNRTGFFNVWGVRFDPPSGRPIGKPFRLTNFDSPRQMLFPFIGSMELSLSADRLAAPIMEVSGNLWILENVDQ